MITSYSRMNKSQTIYAFLAAAGFILVFCYSETAIACARRAISMCATSIIPSLFPFIIISEIIVNSGWGTFIGRLFNQFFGKIFGISSSSACAVVLGSLCGFPIGTKTVLSLLDTGAIDKSEAEHLITFCNVPSSTFLINVVGITLYSNSVTGVILYCITLINSALIGFIHSVTKTRNVRHSISYSRSASASSSIFVNAVNNSIPSILVICSYIIFFSVITGCVEQALTAINCPDLITVSMFGVVEMVGGVTKSSELGNNILSLSLTSFFIGWSGLSVHCQMASLCRKHDLNLKKYFISKIILGLLNALSISIIYYIKPSIFFHSQNTVSAIYFPDLHDAWARYCIVLFTISTTVYLMRKKHKSTVFIIY